MNKESFEISLICWLVAQALIVPWMFKARPDKKLLDKYSKKLILQSSLPFGKKWKTGIAQEDIAVFEKYQKRIKIWYLFAMIPFFCFFFWNILEFKEYACSNRLVLTGIPVVSGC